MRLSKNKINFFSKKKFIKTNQKKLINKLDKVLKSGIYTNGNQTKIFESKFAKFNNSKYCLAVNSGTSALHLALKSIGIKKNDEVIVPAITFIATPAAVTYCQAIPIFVDISKDNWLIDINKIEEKITPKTKAILVVHLHGLMVDMVKIRRLSKKYKLNIIEDASQAHGSKFLGKPPGHFSDAAVFSFYPTKSLGSFGEGGAVITNKKKIFSKIYNLRDWAKNKQDFNEIGFNYRMPEFIATLLTESLKELNEDLKKRILIAKYYNFNLGKKITKCIFNDQKYVHSYYVCGIIVKKKKKLIKYLNKKKIETNNIYNYSLPFCKPFYNHKVKKSEYMNSIYFSKNNLALPTYPELNLKQVKYICDCINHFYEKK